MAMTVCPTAARPPSRSTSDQRRPSASPRLIPVVERSTNAAYSRSAAIASWKARSSSALHVTFSGDPHAVARGGSAASATLRGRRPHLTAPGRRRLLRDRERHTVVAAVLVASEEVDHARSDFGTTEPNGFLRPVVCALHQQHIMFAVELDGDATVTDDDAAGHSNS